MLNTSQIGHWYKCRKIKCDLRIPLPYRLFIDSDVDEAQKAECKCGHINYFQEFHALEETKKWEVDNYFDIRDPRTRFYWVD